MTSSTATSTRNDAALTPKAAPTPATPISAPARAGPMARARLKVTELRAMAESRSARRTSWGTRAWIMGTDTA